MNTSELKILIEKTKELKVLYIEDNKETRLQSLKMFKNFFDFIDVAVDGIDGLEKYKEKEKKFYDLVISDVNMPGMNGVDMTKAMLKINYNQNIIFMTAYNDSNSLKTFMDIGVSNYIHKPIETDIFFKAIQKVIDNLNLQHSETTNSDQIKLDHELDILVKSFDTHVVASKTDLEGKITYASKAFEDLSGYSADELLDKPQNIIRHPDMPSSVFKDMWNTIQDEKAWVGEVKILRKNGEHCWVKANIIPCYDKNKKHIGYSAIRVDITAQKEIEELNAQVNHLLDSITQGFLSFDKELKIEKSFSKECLSIFNKDNIYKDNISELLFANNSLKKDLFTNGMMKILNSDDDIMREMFLSILPKEHTLNDKNIHIDYKLLANDKFMLILTDTTDTKKLQKQIKEQKQIQKMIIAIASDKDEFIKIKSDFEKFLSEPNKKVEALLYELAKFKTIFIAKEMSNIIYGIHYLERKIAKIMEDNTIDTQTVIEEFKAHNLQDIFNIDLKILSTALGYKF